MNQRQFIFFKRGGRDIQIFKLYKIAGTIISKSNIKATVKILTTNGVVDVKFTKEYYAMNNRLISEKQSDGRTKILEKGLFTLGIKNIDQVIEEKIILQLKNINQHQLIKNIEL